ncbi:MAG: hypothetical protein N2312_01775 [Dictyoglomaceae bacterium]|nr:hypothetical protein [Dictyoglomaceae bacterium]
MKKYCLIISFLVILVLLLISLDRTQEIQTVRWEYRVKYEYAGPLCNDGINAQFILFKRPIK